MKIRIKRIIQKPFIRNVIVLASGTAAAQIIALFSSPIITRLYGPEAFGLMGVFMSLVQMLIPVAALTYPIAIVLPKDDRDAKTLIRLSLYVAFGMSVVISFILLVFNKPIIKMFQIQEVSSYLFLIPLVIVLAALLQVMNQWLIRTKQFGINAKVAFLQALIINASKIGMGFINPIASVLIILSASASGLRAALMYFFIKKSQHRPRKIVENHKPLTIKQIAIKHLDFPKFRAPEVLINSVSQRFPILMLTAFFGPASAGFYTIGNTVLQQPIRLIGESVGNVFYPRISEAKHNNESLSKLIIKATLILAGVGIIPFGIIILYGPFIFSFVFGPEWVVAGKYAQWVGLYLFFEFINKACVRSLPVLSAQLFHLNFTIISSVVRIASLMIGYYLFASDIFAIALFGLSSAILHIILILLVIKRSIDYDKNNLK